MTDWGFAIVVVLFFCADRLGRIALALETLVATTKKETTKP